MSIDKNIDQTCDVEITDNCDVIELIIKPREKDLGGFSVRRILPFAKKRAVGPWVFFDHMGPAEFSAGHGVNVRPHPHINLATVTYLFEGEILHRDSLGYVQPIRPGDINLMVAGSGIVHSERERPEIKNSVHRLHGLQLWLALPEKDQECDPEFHHYPADDIPTAVVDGVPLRVIMGSAFGLTSPVKTYAKTLYVEAHLKPGQSIILPNADERAVYIATGKMMAKDTEIGEHNMAVFEPCDGIKLTAIDESRIAIIGGENIGRRFIDWNFVSSTKERIEKAKQDWREGNFAKVPGDDKEFIPLPD
ncbi:MAG: pirin family protein [Alphaproteobacteria bacterium]|nr:pirin family protein [Alphaproteobacteria bacterium]HPF46747.1 pirin family protein [Emcibacteraceae bacterium]